MELAELWIQSSNTSRGYGSVTVVEPTGIHYIPVHLKSSQASILSSERVNDTLILQGYYNSSFILIIPFYVTPVTFDELPKNEDLGIIIPPSVLQLNESDYYIFSTSIGF